MTNYPDPILRVELLSYYVTPQDVQGSQWLRTHLGSGSAVCADQISRYQILASYGQLPLPYPYAPALLPQYCDLRHATIYLNTLNTVYRVGLSYQQIWQMSVIAKELIIRNRIYSNGGSTIYV